MVVAFVLFADSSISPYFWYERSILTLNTAAEWLSDGTATLAIRFVGQAVALDNASYPIKGIAYSDAVVQRVGVDDEFVLLFLLICLPCGLYFLVFAARICFL